MSTPSAPRRLVTLEGVRAGYGDIPVLRDVSVELRSGRMIGVVGPNGSGKTTCLRTITGHTSLTSGRVLLADRDLASYSAREVAQIVAVLPQAVPVEFGFTAAEYVALGRNPRAARFGGLDSLDADVVERVLRLTETEDLADEPVDTLSGGDLQRVALAQALAQEPEVLLLDEPTSHLDLRHRLQILDLVRSLADGGMAVLGVFHDLDLAARYSDEMVVMDAGRIVASGRPGDVVTPDLLREVFAVRAIVTPDVATGTASVRPILRDEEVAGNEGPLVLVIGGSGSAAWLLRRLVVRGHRVALGALNSDDTDAAVGDALGIARVDLAPYASIGTAEEERVRRLADRADAVVVASTPIGRGNLGNLRAVVSCRAPVVLVGAMESSRDFTSGEAEALWSEAATKGAVVVESDAEALAAVEELVAG
jgi:iron complex transport system ATP-binding protein